VSCSRCFPRPRRERAPASLAAARCELHTILQQANHDMGKQQLNTVASATMKMLNVLERLPEAEPAARARLAEEGLSLLLRVLAPIAPHLVHVLWRECGFGEDVLDAPWPEPDPTALQRSEVELVLQVNGKTRGKIVVPAEADQAAIEAAALQAAAHHLEDARPSASRRPRSPRQSRGVRKSRWPSLRFVPSPGAACCSPPQD